MTEQHEPNEPQLIELTPPQPTEPYGLTAPQLGELVEQPSAPGEYSNLEVFASTVPPRAPRRKPRLATVVRWTAFAVVLAASATATAFAVTAPARTDIPGLATPNDGRYRFAPLSLPKLPAGDPIPQDPGTGQRHYAALPSLVLPAPKEAPGSVPAATANCADYSRLHQDSTHMPVLLGTSACRAAATAVWTAKDGTRTEIWLLRFGSSDEGHEFYDALGEKGAIKAVPTGAGTDDTEFYLAPRQHADSYSGSSDGSRNGQPTGMVAYVQSGDVVATVVMTNPHGVPRQAYRQVVDLESALLN
jgi:hypothetical protein